jgi:rare lipoprotein A (peptidoglycan hydrolase)
MKRDGIESKEIEEQFHLASLEGTLREQKGIAFYNKKNENESGFFALHRAAPVGSYLELINPMFGSKVYVKVIGALPEKSYPKEVLTVISNAAAKELGAKDARFFVKIRYLQSELNAGKL